MYDTDANFREAMKVALAKLGHETVFATDGYSVLPLAEQHRPRLIILDFKPPEVDGFEILKRLRVTAACASTPVIFASTTPKFEIEMVIMDAPAVGYIDKPLDVKQLQDGLESFIGVAKPAPAAVAVPKAAVPPPAFNGEPDLDGSRDGVIDLD